jgi:ABC-type siderophore export system fused ATPase/permease subunit
MDSEARTLANLIARTPSLRRSLVIAAALSMFASAAEITVVVALVPILASIGVDAGNTLDGTIAMFPPTGWLVMFAFLAATRSILNWLTAVRTEHGQQELVIHLQSRLYRAMAAAHWDAVRRISPAQLTSALHTQAYEAGYAFSSAARASRVDSGARHRLAPKCSPRGAGIFAFRGLPRIPNRPAPTLRGLDIH